MSAKRRRSPANGTAPLIGGTMTPPAEAKPPVGGTKPADVETSDPRAMLAAIRGIAQEHGDLARVVKDLFHHVERQLQALPSWTPAEVKSENYSLIFRRDAGPKSLGWSLWIWSRDSGEVWHHEARPEDLGRAVRYLPALVAAVKSALDREVEDIKHALGMVAEDLRVMRADQPAGAP